MPDKKIVFLLTSAQEYIKHTGDDEKKYAAQMNIVFEEWIKFDRNIMWKQEVKSNEICM